MADDAGFYRLNRDMVKAKAAVGQDNPSQVREALNQLNQGVLTLDDVSHLAPVSLVPKYSIRKFLGSANPNFATFQIDKAPIPYLIEVFDTFDLTADIVASPNDLAGLTSTTVDSFEPTNQNAPRTLTFKDGTDTARAGGLIVEANRTIVSNMMVEPGTYVRVSAINATDSCNFLFSIQEFPGGLGPL